MRVYEYYVRVCGIVCEYVRVNKYCVSNIGECVTVGIV